jgi:hypothetical protein
VSWWTLAIEMKPGCVPSEGGGPMARRTSDVIDVMDYAERGIMRRGAAPAGAEPIPASRAHWRVVLLSVTVTPRRCS